MLLHLYVMISLDEVYYYRLSVDIILLTNGIIVCYTIIDQSP